MNAPLGRTPEKLGRCECRESRCFVESCLHTSWNDAKAWGVLDDYETRCIRRAVRLVNVRNKAGAYVLKPGDLYERDPVPMCEPCAQHHERASHTERTTEKGGRE